jgi:hypothetical protein
MALRATDGLAHPKEVRLNMVGQITVTHGPSRANTSWGLRVRPPRTQGSDDDENRDSNPTHPRPVVR